MVRRESVRNELENCFGPYYEKLEVAATYNLFLNVAYMVRERVGAALCFQMNREYPGTKFIPLTPVLEQSSRWSNPSDSNSARSDSASSG